MPSLFIYGLVPNHLRPGTGPRPSGWGPLSYGDVQCPTTTQQLVWLMTAVCLNSDLTDSSK